MTESAVKIINDALIRGRVHRLTSELEGADRERTREILSEVNKVRKGEWLHEDAAAILEEIAEGVVDGRYDLGGGEILDSSSEVLDNADLVKNDINILGVISSTFMEQSQSHDGYLLIEFKWWYGDAPNESRWQKTILNMDADDRARMVALAISKVKAIRLQIEKQTGVSQNVRH